MAGNLIFLLAIQGSCNILKFNETGDLNKPADRKVRGIMKIGKLLTSNAFALPLIAFISIVIGLSCGKDKPEMIARPWINTDYRDSANFVLQEKAKEGDTLAAMVLGWQYMLHEDSAAAADYLTDYNNNPPQASPAINYLTGLALKGAKRDSLAVEYFLPIKDSEEYPHAAYYLANLYRKMKKHEQALEIYEKFDPEIWGGGIEDSILVCHASMGDTASAMKFARKMFDQNNAFRAVPYLSKYVSLKRGESPTLWNYMAGMGYYQGNNSTRAAVFLENADADTNVAHLSYYLGLTYYKLQVYDSASSKLEQAMEMGDSSVNLMIALMKSYQFQGDTAQALATASQAIQIHPDVEEFYFFPAKILYQGGQYGQLFDFTQQGRMRATDSYKLDAYYAAASFLMGNDSLGNMLVDTLIEKHKFEGGALTEAARLFEESLDKPQIAEKLEANDPAKRFPKTNEFLYWYNYYRDRDMIDSTRSMLERWIEGDTVEARRQLMEELYERDFPELAHKSQTDIEE
ncbi:MAG: tetratricopeptide repeat protein [candidate division Zixibacteria bacterium]|nr:tetratricopeptide repeat protein [candidate division Zixibacteria bacterium]